MLIHKFFLSYGKSTKFVKEAIFILKGGKKLDINTIKHLNKNKYKSKTDFSLYNCKSY